MWDPSSGNGFRDSGFLFGALRTFQFCVFMRGWGGGWREGGGSGIQDEDQD